LYGGEEEREKALAEEAGRRAERREERAICEET